MATFDYSNVPAVVTITANEDVIVPFAVPNFSMALAKDDILKLKADKSVELAYYKKLAEKISVTVSIASIGA